MLTSWSSSTCQGASAARAGAAALTRARASGGGRASIESAWSNRRPGRTRQGEGDVHYDLGGGLNGSSATADVILQNGSSFTVTLRDASEPSWANGSIHQVDAPVPDTVSPPLTADNGIAGVRLNLVQHNPDWSADNWDVASLQVNLYNTGIAPVCQVNLVGTHRLQDGSLGLVRLSKNADSKGSGPMSQVFSGGCS